MQQKILLSTALELFQLENEYKRLAPATLDFYQWNIKPFLDFLALQEVEHLHEITPQHIRTHLASYSEHSSHTQHAAARAIKVWLNYCVRDKLLEASPFERVPMPRTDKKILPALKPEEIERILSACDKPRDRAIVLTLLDSGIRARELVDLNVGHVNMSTGVLTVYSGKGKKDRVTRVGARTRKALRMYWLQRGKLGKDDPAFISEKTGGRLTTSGLNQLMRKIRRLSGADNCKAHALRRTFAISMLRNGVDVHTLARLMGHADVQILKRYLDFDEEDLRRGHERHGPVDNLENFI